MPSQQADTDVLVIGAGPSGAVAASLLVQKGYRVTVFERETFPRFSIGESLLPQCMSFIEEAGMTRAVEEGNFQYKNGATFYRDGQLIEFNFSNKFSAGPETTFQVQRNQFDKILADEATRVGADVRYQHTITAVDVGSELPALSFTDANDKSRKMTARFILDASGFGRVLPRLLDLDTSSHLPSRKAIFTHIEDNISQPDYDRDKILITVHPFRKDVWYWLIPFSNGRCSLGVVATDDFYERFNGDNETVLKNIVSEDKNLYSLLKDAIYDTPVQSIKGYSANVKALYGPGFALLGNAGEFLDPVFSSGVTIALKSASLAAEMVDREMKGEDVNWENDYSQKLMVGVNAFRTFVNAWYDERFQDIIFHDRHLPKVKQMICSILAGYAWDQTNPYVTESERRVDILAEVCRRENLTKTL